MKPIGLLLQQPDWDPLSRAILEHRLNRGLRGYKHSFRRLPPFKGAGPVNPPIAGPSVVRAEVLDRDPLKYSFKNFLWKTWRTLGFPDPTPLQYDTAEFLQFGPDKSIVMGFRGMAKSYITVTYCNWSLYRDPDEIVLNTSGTHRGAALNAYFAFQMISGFDWLAHLRPRTDQRRSALAFDVAGATPKKHESFAADSIFGQITGRRASLIVPDDVELPQNSDTETKRADLEKAFGELGGAVLLPGGRIKVLGTAQQEQSLYPKLAVEKGYTLRMWPILYPLPEERAKFGSWLAPKLDRDLADNPSLAGTSTEPSRFDEADIATREIEWGRTEFARQFKLHLDAGMADSARLKLRDLIVLDWGPPPKPTDALKLPPEVRWGPTKELQIQGLEVDCFNGDGIYAPAYTTPPDQWRPADQRVMYIDPSGGGGDEVSWTIEAVLNAMAFICAQGASLGGYSLAVLQQIAQDAKLWGVTTIYVESNLGQGMFGALLRPELIAIEHPCDIQEDRKGIIQKEHRIIAALEPAFTAHRVVVNRRLLEVDWLVTYETIEDTRKRFYRLTYQLTRITKQKGCLPKDDRADSLGSAVEKVMDLLRQRTKDAQDNDRTLKLQEEAEKMIEERKRQGLPTFGLDGLKGKLGLALKGGLLKSNLWKRGPKQ